MSGPVQPIVLVPSYNTGARLLRRTLDGLLAQGVPILLVLDGSTDDTATEAPRWSEEDDRLTLLAFSDNRGKGAAVLAGAEWAFARGYTHAITVDADGQHEPQAIARFLEAMQAHPSALLMGAPRFGKEAPRARRWGRQLTIFWTDLETLWCGLGDTLFGMRAYPIEALIRAFAQTPFARRFDFDPEIAVRLAWMGLPIVQVPVQCRYFSREEGGVSHFHYLRDNVRLTLLHFRLVPEMFVLRLWSFLAHRRPSMTHVADSS